MNYKAFDDAILLKLLKAGDGSALEEIYVRYSEMVLLAALKKVKSKVIAEELARNSYLRGKLLIEDSHGATVCELPVER